MYRKIVNLEYNNETYKVELYNWEKNHEMIYKRFKKEIMSITTYKNMLKKNDKISLGTSHVMFSKNNSNDKHTYTICNISNLKKYINNIEVDGNPKYNSGDKYMSKILDILDYQKFSHRLELYKKLYKNLGIKEGNLLIYIIFIDKIDKKIIITALTIHNYIHFNFAAAASLHPYVYDIMKVKDKLGEFLTKTAIDTFTGNCPKEFKTKYGLDIKLKELADFHGIKFEV